MRKWLLLGVALAVLVACDDGVKKDYWENGNIKSELRYENGKLNGENHCWNIVRLGEEYYHVDVSRCYDGRFEEGFLLNDEFMWNDYRWNISNYPACTGELRYADVTEDAQETQGPSSEAETADGENGLTADEELPDGNS